MKVDYLFKIFHTQLGEVEGSGSEQSPSPSASATIVRSDPPSPAGQPRGAHQAQAEAGLASCACL